VIGSDTAPVREVLDGENGMLVPFFDAGTLADRVIEALQHPRQFHSMRVRARQTVLDRFDLNRICLPEMMALLHGDGTRSRMAGAGRSQGGGRSRVLARAGQALLARAR
jgi:hypothetical protein